MIEQNTEIINKLGLHARAVAKLVSTSSQFASETTMTFGDKEANCKSIMSVMMLAAAKGSNVTIKCEGKDEENAMQSVIDLIEGYFGEEE